jgi:hypothetical protein
VDELLKCAMMTSPPVENFVMNSQIPEMYSFPFPNPQFMLGVLAQAKNGDKQFWK